MKRCLPLPSDIRRSRIMCTPCRPGLRCLAWMAGGSHHRGRQSHLMCLEAAWLQACGSALLQAWVLHVPWKMP